MWEASRRKRARDWLNQDKISWINCCFSVFMLYVAWKRGLPWKFACFVLFRPIKKRSFHLMCVLDLFFRTLAVNSISDFFPTHIVSKKITMFKFLPHHSQVTGLALNIMQTHIFHVSQKVAHLFEFACVGQQMRSASELYPVIVWTDISITYSVNVETVKHRNKGKENRSCELR